MKPPQDFEIALIGVDYAFQFQVFGGKYTGGPNTSNRE
jgi:hypothetical protein